MSFGGSAPAAPTPPPPPPTPAAPATPSVMEQSAAETARLNSAAGQGFSGTDVTGGQGASNPSTTASGQKTLLG